MQPMVMWPIDEILETRKTLAKIFAWKREVGNDFTVVYGLQVTDYVGITASEIKVSREFCDKFHNPRHLPVLAGDLRYIPKNGAVPENFALYQRVRTFSNGKGYWIPVKWWDKHEEIVECFTTHMHALDRIDYLKDCGIEAKGIWNDTERVWEVCYYGSK